MARQSSAPIGQRAVVVAAATCAAAVIASQLAGKAARDAIFLQQFSVTSLPMVLAVSSLLAVATTFAFARWLSRSVPARVVRVVNLASAAALLAEWALLEHAPRPVAALIYLHQTLLGPILVSGFWSLVSECFDPRTARRVMGTIGTGATLGGLAGALIAERVAALAGTAALLPVIAGLQLVAMWRMGGLARAGTAAVLAGDAAASTVPPVREVVEKFSRLSLLRRLAAITVVVTMAAAFLDYAFKAAVAAETPRDDLARVFALFHGTVGLLTAVVSWTMGRAALQSWGLARTLAMLPGSVIVFGALALVAPGLGTFIALRGAENVVRNSLYREAYEVFYTPLLAADRRATKTVIDVGVERFGDVLGGVAVLALLALAPDAMQLLVIGALALSGIGVAIALKAQQSYVDALEHSLLARAETIDVSEAPDRTTRTTLEHLVQRTRPRYRPLPDPDRDLGIIKLLRSRDPRKVRQGLELPLDPATLPYAIPLLARADLDPDVARAIALVAKTCAGQLVDAARDPALPLGARVQLPALIATAGDELARAGLVACLHDPDFDVRYAAAHALLELCERAQLALDRHAVFERVHVELAIDPARWRALDATTRQPGEPLSRAAQHLATLLSLALPAEPVRTAFHGLWSDDTAFRGVALEYLENVLPGDIRANMWRVLAIEAPVPPARRPVQEVRADLLRTAGPAAQPA